MIHDEMKMQIDLPKRQRLEILRDFLPLFHGDNNENEIIIFRFESINMIIMTFLELMCHNRLLPWGSYQVELRVKLPSFEYFIYGCLKMFSCFVVWLWYHAQLESNKNLFSLICNLSSRINDFVCL